MEKESEKGFIYLGTYVCKIYAYILSMYRYKIKRVCVYLRHLAVHTETNKNVNQLYFSERVSEHCNL